MAIEIVSFPIKDGGSFHSYVNVYQRVSRKILNNIMGICLYIYIIILILIIIIIGKIIPGFPSPMACGWFPFHHFPGAEPTDPRKAQMDGHVLHPHCAARTFRWWEENPIWKGGKWSTISDIYIMIFDDIWWYLMIFDDIWWYLMISVIIIYNYILYIIIILCVYI